MTDVTDAILAAFADAEDDRRREQRTRALKVLATIPNDTPDSELTPEQLQAWRDYEETFSTEKAPQ